MEIENIVKHFHELNDDSPSVTLPYTFTLHSLIGSINTDRFYSYRGKIFSHRNAQWWWQVMIIGSLTTPSCNEAVTWIIFPDTIPISLSQMAKFRSLSNGIEGLLLVDNYRHLQPVGNRKVFIRSVSSRFLMLDRMQTESEEEDLNPSSIWYYNWHRWASKFIKFLFSLKLQIKICFKWLFWV